MFKVNFLCPYCLKQQTIRIKVRDITWSDRVDVRCGFCGNYTNSGVTDRFTLLARRIYVRVTDWWNDYGIVVMLLAAVIVLTSFVVLADRHACYKVAGEMGYNAKVSAGITCMIEVEPEKWVPLSSYQYIVPETEKRHE